MGDVDFRRLIGFYASQFCYIIAGSALLAFFIVPELEFLVSNLLWMVFVEKRFDVGVFLICNAAVVLYLFGINDEEKTELFPVPDLPLTPFYHPEYLQFPLPDLPPSDPHPVLTTTPPPSTSSPPPSPLSPSSITPPPSSPPSACCSPAHSFSSDLTSSRRSSRRSPSPSVASSFLETTPPPSSPPSACFSPAHSFSSSNLTSSPRSPPPPPFKIKPWKIYTQGDYSWIGSDSDTDVDTKAEQFITQFRRRLRHENKKSRR